MTDADQIQAGAITAETLAEDADIRRRYPLPWHVDSEGAVRDARGMLVVNRAAQFPLEPALSRFIARRIGAEQ